MDTTHRKNTPAISWTWEEGKYWDLWMIVHFWSGVVIGLVIPYINAPVDFLLGVAFLGMVIWELIEYFFDVHEVTENRILDVVFGVAGMTVALNYLVPWLEDISREGTGLFIGVCILLALGFCGWSAFRKREQK